MSRHQNAAIAADAIGILERGQYLAPSGKRVSMLDAASRVSMLEVASRLTHEQSDHMIDAPDVPVFRDDVGELLETPYRAAFITSHAPNATVIASRANAFQKPPVSNGLFQAAFERVIFAILDNKPNRPMLEALHTDLRCTEGFGSKIPFNTVFPKGESTVQDGVEERNRR